MRVCCKDDGCRIMVMVDDTMDVSWRRGVVFRVKLGVSPVQSCGPNNKQSPGTLSPSTEMVSSGGCVQDCKSLMSAVQRMIAHWVCKCLLRLPKGSSLLGDCNRPITRIRVAVIAVRIVSWLVLAPQCLALHR